MAVITTIIVSINRINVIMASENIKIGDNICDGLFRAPWRRRLRADSGCQGSDVSGQTAVVRQTPHQRNTIGWNERNTVSLRERNTGDSYARVSRKAGSVQRAFLRTDKTLATVRKVGWI